MTLLLINVVTTYNTPKYVTQDWIYSPFRIILSPRQEGLVSKKVRMGRVSCRDEGGEVYFIPGYWSLRSVDE